MKISSMPSLRSQRLLGLAAIATLQLTLDLATPGANTAQAADGALPQYTLQRLDNLASSQGYRPFALPQGLNGAGTVVGRTEYVGGPLPVPAATLWPAAGAPQGLQRLPAGWTFGNARDINDGGLIVGTLATGNFQYTAVRWGSDGSLVDLGARAGAANSEAMAINTIWQAVGSAARSQNAEAALWQPDGSFVSLGHLQRVGDPSVYSMGTGITDSGSVAGFTRFATGDTQSWRWSPVSGYSALQQSAPGSSDLAHGLNATGWVVGESSGPDLQSVPNRAVAWDPQGRLVEIQGIGFTQTRALDINDSGMVVGEGSFGGFGQGWIWTEGSGMVALDSLVPGVGSFRIQSASAINEFGQITGWGYDSATGVSSAYLLSPSAVPEPGPAALLAAGLLGLAWRRGRMVRPRA